MLRVVAHKSAAAACKYYAEVLSRRDYYTEGQEMVDKWHGKGAQLLGLTEGVTKEAFEALVNNRHPETGKQLTPRMKADRRVGYDLNFHAPKSLSLVHAFTGDERIVTAFRSAVAKTMSEIEVFASTRVRRGGAQSERLTGNLVWAEFVHLTARPVDGIPDPHLHIHIYAPNLTFDDVENRWKAASWLGIKNDAPYFQAVFHAHLTREIGTLGYGIDRSPTGWEIAGIPRTLIDGFSRRTAQINRVAQAKGITDPKKLDALGALTREKKGKELTEADLLAAWNARLTREERAIIAKVGADRQAKILRDPITPEKAFDEACEKVFAKNSVVDPKRLVAEMLRFGVGRVSPDQAWKEFERRDMVVGKVDGEWLCTSHQVLAEEIALINFVRSGRGRYAPLVPGPLNLQDPRMIGEAGVAVRHILKSADQVIGVRGAAGTGKTTLMSEVKAQLEAEGITLFAFAPSAAASREKLREDGFANAQTVAHLLLSQKLQNETRGQVIWIDEAGQLGVEDMAEIMRIAGDSTRVILTGDTAQHAPVPRGDAFRIIQRYAGLRVAELTEIRRQDRDDYRNAVMALSKGDLRTGFRRLEDLGAIIEIADEPERYRQLAQDYLNLSHGGQIPLVVSPTHAEGAKVTDAIRSARSDAGLLGPEKTFVQYRDLNWEIPDRRHAENYATGMVVQFNQNVPGFQRGAMLHVLGTDENGAVLAVDAKGRQVELPLQQAKRFQVFEQREITLAQGDRIRITRGGKSADGKRLNNGNVFTVAKFTKDGQIVLSNGAKLETDFGHLALGYVSTSHASQGKSVRDVLVAQSTDSIFVSSREQFYVSVSRGRETLRIYTDDRTELQKAVGNSSTRRSGVELAGFTKEQIAAAMSGELDSHKWRDMIQSRRANGPAHAHVQNLLRERRQEGTKKPEMSFQQYVAMRRGLSGPDGKSRSKGHPHAPAKKGNNPARGRSFLRPTELTEPTKQKLSAPKPAKETPKKAPQTRVERAAKAYESAKKHFKKIATQTKTAIQSIKKGTRSKLFPEMGSKQLGKHHVKKQASDGAVKAKIPEKTKTKAPTPPPPGPRRTR